MSHPKPNGTCRRPTNHGSPDSGLVAYLHGRALYNRGQADRALAELDRAGQLGVGDPLVLRELERLEPLVAFAARRLDRAAEGWARLSRRAAGAHSAATVRNALDWLDRLRFETDGKLPPRRCDDCGSPGER